MANWSCPDAELILSVDEAKDRPRWLAERRSGIGGSDVAALMGEGKYSTEFEVWLDKTGRVADKELTIQMEMGARMESAIAEKFSDDYALEVRRRGMLRSKTHPVHLYNADRLVEDGYLLEIKVVNGFFKMPADLTVRGGIPGHWYWQDIEGLLVTGRQGIYHAVAIGNHDFQVRTLDRSDPQVAADIERLREVVTPWWQEYVIEGKVPSMGAPPAIPSDLPEKDRFSFFIPEEGFEIRDRLREIRETKRELEAEDKEIKAKLQAETGGARWIYADGRPILELNPRSGRKTFNKKAFFGESPLNGRQLREWLEKNGRWGEVSEALEGFVMTEEDYTTRGAPGTALLIVGDAEE
jgi:putative phage-type endonuclease